MLKDQTNKKEHASSAQLACEAAGAIRTVASLGREEDCCRKYSESLETPLRRSYRAGLLSNLIYSLSQSMGFFVIALVFWYGSLLVSRLELDMFNFFVSLMVSRSIFTAARSFAKSHSIRAPPSAPSRQEMFSRSSQISRLPAVPLSTSSSSWIPNPRSTPIQQRVSSSRSLLDVFALKASTSVTPLALVSVSSVTSPSLSNLVPLSPSLDRPVQENLPPSN